MSLPRLLSALISVILLAGCLPGGETATPPRLAVAGDETLLQLTLPSHRVRGVLSLAGRNGDVETWASADGFSVSLRQGVVVATRGFGFDLMAGDAQVTLDALAMPGGEVYSRRMRYLTSDNHSTWVQAGCTMAATRDDAGQVRFDETCQARQNRFTNRYWLDGGGNVRRSRQWISAETGYAEIEFVRR